MKIGDLLKQKDPHDKFNLKRFHDAQSFVYDEILMEVHAGKKQTNWIVFMLLFFVVVVCFLSDALRKLWQVSKRV